MNAYEVYDAAFDSAADPKKVIEEIGSVAEYVKAYADGAFDIVLSDEVANKIAECANNIANYEGYDWGHAHYVMVQQPLEEIEV